LNFRQLVTELVVNLGLDLLGLRVTLRRLGCKLVELRDTLIKVLPQVADVLQNVPALFSFPSAADNTCNFVHLVNFNLVFGHRVSAHNQIDCCQKVVHFSELGIFLSWWRWFSIRCI
jgi:hypothetical protein